MRLKLLQIAISGIILILLFTKIPLQELMRVWQEIHWIYYALALGAMMAASLVATLKWKLLLPTMSFSYLLTQNLLAIVYSIALVGQLSGEAIKVYRVSKGETQKPKVFASILADKATGLLILFAFTLLTLPLTARYASAAFVPVLLTAVVGTILILATMVAPVRLTSRIQSMRFRSFTLEKKKVQYAEIISATAQTYQNYRKPSTFVQMLFWSIVFQLLGTMCFLFTVQAFHLQLPFSEAMWIFALVSILLFLPLSIGGLGVREGAMVFLLGTRGISPEHAVAVSLAFFSLSVIMGLLGILLEFFYANSRKQSIE